MPTFREFSIKPFSNAFAALAVFAQGSFCAPAFAQDTSSDQTAAILQDVNAVCHLVATRYAYYETRRDAWEEACLQARAEAESPLVLGQAGHLALLERLIDQLWDNHVSLNTNSAVSPRLVPSGSDLWIEWQNGEAVIGAVRPDSGAALAGLQVGDVVLAINGDPVPGAAMTRIQAGRTQVPDARLEWALNAEAAGYRGAPRQFTIRRQDGVQAFAVEQPEPAPANRLVTARRLPGNIGYIRFEDSLDDDLTVEAFDAALEALRGADGWIIDLRNTPGGGNTDVAEPILGRFISGVKPYQKSGPRWQGEPVRYAASRGPWRVRGKLAVLAGRWTGSMGEGMAVGFDGLRRGRVFGSPMAGLAGGVCGFELPGSGISLRIPTYNLMHISGIDRHHWRPAEAVVADNGNGHDIALEAAMNWLD